MEQQQVETANDINEEAIIQQQEINAKHKTDQFIEENIKDIKKKIEQGVEIQWSKEKFSSFLKANNWRIESLVDWEEWSFLTSEQQTELKILCHQELTFQRAKDWLKSDQRNTINDVLKQEEFACLQNNKKVKDWIKNQIYYQKKRQWKSSQNQDDNLSTILSFSCQSQNLSKKNISEIFNQPLSALTSQTNQYADDKLQYLAQENWNKLLKACEKSTYKERVNLFQTYYFKDPLTFVQQIKEYSLEQTIQDIFSILLSIIFQLESSHEKTNLLAASFRFYNFEIIKCELQYLSFKDSISNLIKKLQMENFAEEIQGFLKFLFVNNIQLTEEQINEITFLCQLASQAWKSFINQLQNAPFNLRCEIVQRLQKTGQIFRPQIVQLLKETRGEIFLKVTEEYRRPILEICVFSSDDDSDTLRNFIERLSDNIQGYRFILDKAKFILYLYGMVEELKLKNATWYKNLKKTGEIIFKIIQGIIEAKIIDVKPLMSCLKGDFQSLNNELQKTKLIISGGLEELQNIANTFKFKNQNDEYIQNYKIQDFKDEVENLFIKIENEFGRPFHNIQAFCIKYVLSVLGKRNTFLQFGLGNGKTLISTSLSILIS